MFSRTLPAVLLFLALACAAVRADELQINPNHPDQYTVVRGILCGTSPGGSCNTPGNGRNFGVTTL